MPGFQSLVLWVVAFFGLISSYKIDYISILKIDRFAADFPKYRNISNALFHPRQEILLSTEIKIVKDCDKQQDDIHDMEILEWFVDQVKYYELNYEVVCNRADFLFSHSNTEADYKLVITSPDLFVWNVTAVTNKCTERTDKGICVWLDTSNEETNSFALVPTSQWNNIAKYIKNNMIEKYFHEPYTSLEDVLADYQLSKGGTDNLHVIEPLTPGVFSYTNSANHLCPYASNIYPSVMTSNLHCFTLETDCSISCQQFLQSPKIASFADFLEIGSDQHLSRSSHFHRGVSIFSTELSSLNMNQLRRLGKMIIPNIDIRSDDQIDFMSEVLTKYNSFKLLYIENQHMSIDSGLIFLSNILDALLQQSTVSSLPCAVVMKLTRVFDNTMLQQDIATSFFLYKYGLYLSTSFDTEFIVFKSSHCDEHDFRKERYQEIISESILDLITSSIDLSEAHEELIPYDQNSITQEISLGQQITQKGHEYVVLNELLPERLMQLLMARLEQCPEVDFGATSFFVPFNISFKPRSIIEEILLTYIIPNVVGNLSQAIHDGFLGAEWWIQKREASSPKEFHMDTAITWCRDNGWPKELLTACNFYPTVGSVYYLSDRGGATVAFNHSATDRGMKPAIPPDVAVIIPKKNRLLLFRGDQLHGVSHSHKNRPVACEDDAVYDSSHYCSIHREPRITFLVNYWKNRTAGETFTHVLPNEKFFQNELRRVTKLIGQSSNNKIKFTAVPQKLVEINSEFDFGNDFSNWQSQSIPSHMLEQMENMPSDVESQCNNEIDLYCRPYLFHIPKGELGRKLDELKGYAFETWHRWKIDLNTQVIVPTFLNLPKLEEPDL